MPKSFVPRVLSTKHVPSTPMREWAQGFADAAFDRVRLGTDGLETDAVEVCASRGPVAPHRDTDGTQQGMRVFGLVIRSDGHRLHSDALDAAGCQEGLALAPGDLYQIDPFDRHWTTAPDGQAQLLFSVNVMHPDGRTPARMAHDMWWTILAASIEARRHGAAA